VSVVSTAQDRTVTDLSVKQVELESTTCFNNMTPQYFRKFDGMS